MEYVMIICPSFDWANASQQAQLAAYQALEQYIAHKLGEKVIYSQTYYQNDMPVEVACYNIADMIGLTEGKVTMLDTIFKALLSPACRILVTTEPAQVIAENNLKDSANV